MRWYAWVAVVFFCCVAAAGLAVTAVARIFVGMLRDGTWVENGFLVDAVAAGARGGEDPIELFEFYIGFGFAVLLVGLAGVAGAAVLGVMLNKGALATSVAQPTQLPPSSPAAGWYPVQDGSGRVAWWDGQSWDSSVVPPSGPGR